MFCAGTKFELTRAFTVNISFVEVPITTLPFKKTFAPSVEVPVTLNAPSTVWFPWMEAFPTERFCVKRFVVVALVNTASLAS